MKKQILFIDDEPFHNRTLLLLLERADFEVTACSTVYETLQIIKDKKFDIVILDIMMNPGPFSHIETAGGTRTGIVLGNKIRQYLPDAIFIGYSLSRDIDIREWFRKGDKVLFIEKGTSPIYFLEKIETLVLGKKVQHKIFIVHGHDTAIVFELKNFIQNNLKLEEPIVLSEKPSNGMTLIEKFEFYAKDSDIVFAILSPDDLLNNNKAQARPNVIFELGYFLGKIGRRQGKIFLLFKQPTNLPSDLHGVIYIDITDGIIKAGELIRMELSEII